MKNRRDPLRTFVDRSNPCKPGVGAFQGGPEKSTKALTTRTSVTGSVTVSRLDIASRCGWLFERAIAIRVLPSSRAECRRMGPAISIEASRASCLIQLSGAFPECASRLASSARATASIPRARRSMISPKVQISCSEYCPDIRTSVACHKARSRLSSQPCAIDSSSCLKSDAEWLRGDQDR